MSTLEHLPELDKAALIGGCSRLPLRYNAPRLLAEVLALPKSLWGSNAGRVGSQFAAQAIFLRGHAASSRSTIAMRWRARRTRAS